MGSGRRVNTTIVVSVIAVIEIVVELHATF